jgi:hypothetical protein
VGDCSSTHQPLDHPNDPPPAHREHAVGAVVSEPAVVGAHSWRAHAHHHQLATAGDLVKLGPYAMLGPMPQHLLQLVAAMADLRGRVLECGIQVGPLQVRIDQLSIAARSPLA